MTTDISLVEELNLVKNSADPRAPFFTGWKSCDPTSWMTDQPGDPSLGCVGQLIQFVGDPITCGVYVNLPGFESGIIPLGATINIGDERLYVAPSLGEMRRMLLEALVILKNLATKAEADQPK
jgi:hypothetical protein